LPERGERRHRSALDLPVLVGQRRDEILVAVRVRLPDDDEARRILIGKLIEEDGLDDAEDRRVRADAEDQRQDRDGGERRLPEERPNRVAKIT
jgi:hypothetical protein